MGRGLEEMDSPCRVMLGQEDPRRIARVKEIFSTISERYDFLNHLLSLRRDVFWRRFAVRQAAFPRNRRFLDVACGTGDLAIEAALCHPEISVVGVDFAQAMLDRGGRKVARGGLSGRIYLVRGDALSLPFPKDLFDTAGIAFGIRNIPDKVGALREIRRVVAPGGRVLILELSLPQKGWFRRCYDLYLNRILPRIAALYSSNPGAYRYLADSVMDFPSVEAFMGIMREAGWAEVRAHALTLGICRLYTGRKPEREDCADHGLRNHPI